MMSEKGANILAVKLSILRRVGQLPHIAVDCFSLPRNNPEEPNQIDLATYARSDKSAYFCAFSILLDAEKFVQGHFL